jgi:hypothetical protein
MLMQFPLLLLAALFSTLAVRALRSRVVFATHRLESVAGGIMFFIGKSALKKELVISFAL